MALPDAPFDVDFFQVQKRRNLTGMRVLAIDDEEDSLGLLRVLLGTAGATVITMASALDALQQVAELAPDVLVVDLGTPHMDGLEFIPRIRGSENAAVRDLPAASFTALARSDDRTRALQSGFEMHLPKPVDPGELVRPSRRCQCNERGSAVCLPART